MNWCSIHLTVSATRALTVVFVVAGLGVSKAAAEPGDQSGWSLFPSPVAVDLHGLAATPDGATWAVGDRGTILRFDGRVWLPENSPVSTNLNAAATDQGNDTWIVGDHGTALHRIGDRWIAVAGIPDHVELLGVATRDGFTVAVGRGPDPKASHNAVVFEYVAGSWREPFIPAYQASELRSVAVFGVRHWLAVGAHSNQSRRDSVLLLQNCRSEPCDTLIQTDDAGALNDLSLLADNNLWAVGANRHILRRVNDTWITHPKPPTMTAVEHLGVHAVSAETAWIVGQGGRIVRQQGYDEAQIASPTTAQLNDVLFTADGIGWAVGAEGVILRHGPPIVHAAVFLPALHR